MSLLDFEHRDRLRAEKVWRAQMGALAKIIANLAYALIGGNLVDNFVKGADLALRNYAWSAVGAGLLAYVVLTAHRRIEFDD